MVSVAGGCRVLFVDDDAAAVEEYAELASRLGYDCLQATDAGEALRLLGQDSAIGIVVTDLQMPGIDGLSFLDELACRVTLDRPVVPMVITGHSSLDAAVRAMRHNAVDFLVKPVTPEGFAEALRRASRTWVRLVGASTIGRLAGSIRGATAEAPAGGAAREPTKEDLAKLVRLIMRSRERRGEFLQGDLFSDPTWDILLDLTAGALEDRDVPVSSACAASRVPLSTALRHVRQLVDAGQVRRWEDPRDRRRDLLALEAETREAMQAYLTSVWHKFSDQLTEQP